MVTKRFNMLPFVTKGYVEQHFETRQITFCCSKPIVTPRNTLSKKISFLLFS